MFHKKLFYKYHLAEATQIRWYSFLDWTSTHLRKIEISLRSPPPFVSLNFFNNI